VREDYVLGLKKTLLRSVVVLTATLGASASQAGDETLAEVLFREGTALMQAGDYAHACPKLAESYRQDPATGALLVLGLCQERGGQLASAWTTYNAVIGLAMHERRSDRVQAARKHAAALEPRLPKVTVEVPAEASAQPGFSVTCDSVLLPPAAWGSPIPVDPGKHSIEATANGKARWKQTLTIETEAARETIRVPVLEPAEDRALPSSPVVGTVPSPAPAAPAAVLPELPRAPPPAREPASTTPVATASPLRTLGVVAGGTGVLGLGLGLALGLNAISLNNQSLEHDHCDAVTGCDDNGATLNHEAVRYARAASTLLVVGGGLIAGGITLYVIGSAKQRPAVVSVGASSSLAGAPPGFTFKAAF
jgi:hypothetical protein